MKNLFSISILIASLAVTWPLLAHHSFGEYDFQHPTEIEGKLLEVAWQNPHVHFKLQSVDENGRVVVWDIEGHSVSILRRTDVKQENLKVGETVKIFGAPSQRSSRRFFVTNVLLNNGQELVLSLDEKMERKPY